MSEIPSKVYDRNFIQIPKQGKVIESDDEWGQCGKWILTNNSKSMHWIDETWSRLQILLNKGYLIMLKASTAAMARNPNLAGTILCYTRPGEEEVHLAAKEIRKSVHYEYCMYYKMNYMTENKIDHRYGHKRIPRYMHTPKGFFYKSSEEGWVLVSINIDFIVLYIYTYEV